MGWIYSATEDRPPLRRTETDTSLSILRLLERAVSATSDGIVVTDPHLKDHPIVFVNEGFLRLTGYSEKDILGRNCRFLQGPDTDPAAVREVRSAIREKRSCRVVLKNYRKDGSGFWNELVVDPLLDTQGHVTHFVGVQTDITAYKEKEDAVQTEILKRLAQAAEFRDDETGRHTERVGRVAAQIAQTLGFSVDEVALIRLAAPLHDVGKIGISDLILLKPGTFTPEEKDTMKRHTWIGSQILSGQGFRLLQVAEEIALTHHERWDGLGYPNGLKGDAIPLVGRIVAVADVFDALIHERPYKKAWPLAEAVEEIKNQSGTAFDPEVVQAFVSLLDRLPSLIGD